MYLEETDLEEWPGVRGEGGFWVVLGFQVGGGGEGRREMLSTQEKVKTSENCDIKT